MNIKGGAKDQAHKKNKTSSAALSVSGLLLFVLMVMLDGRPDNANFVRVEGNKFMLGTEPYTFAGINYWQGAYLGADVVVGGKKRLLRELDLLKKYGITNLRIMASSEKSSSSLSVTPTFQESPGKYNEALLQGLDFLLDEMRKRDMKAVLVMNNYWEWSGGMAQYVAWTSGKKPIHRSKKRRFHDFALYTSDFYKEPKALDAYFKYIEHVMKRTNTINGLRYASDPTIMTWQPANEPRPHPDGKKTPHLLDDYFSWVDKTAQLIHTLSPHQLVSLGSEGTVGNLGKPEVYLKSHAFNAVDYLTFHIWPKNWRWYSPENPKNSLADSIRRTENYFAKHIAFANQLGKPAVLEEFGIGRDGEAFSHKASVRSRDLYLRSIFELVENDVRENGPMAGTNIWAWGGEGRAHNDTVHWKEGADFTGDPPHEPQGLNSVFDTDISTLTLIRDHATELRRLSSKREMGTVN